jgi:hypothetical protein
MQKYPLNGVPHNLSELENKKDAASNSNINYSSLANYRSNYQIPRNSPSII